MKKFAASMLAVLLLITLTACSSGEKSGTKQKVTETPAPLSAAKDTDVMALHFTAPEGCETVKRYTNKDSSGSLTEKSFDYIFADNSEIIIGYTKGKSITDSIPQSALDKATTGTYSGREFTVVEEGKTMMALNQENDVVYGIGYTFAETVDKAQFESFMSAISFTDAVTTEENDEDMFDIRFDAASVGTVCSTNITLSEKPDGTVVEKTMGWHYGTDEENLDYRFLIRVYKNSTVEEQLSSGKEYEQQVINGITYTVRKAEEGKQPFEYFTQNGNDVYKIYNNGSGSWVTTRSEQSETAFMALLNSISFA